MSLPRYPEYKASGVPWLGEVPAHWAITPLKHLVRLRSGGTPSKERTDYWDGAVPWASSKDLKVEVLGDTIDHVTSLAVEDGAAEMVPVGASLVVVRGMILAHSFPVARVARAMAINQDLKAVLPNDAIREDFLAWLLRGSARESLARLDEAAHGTKALRMGAWSSMELPVPPPEEQARIAAFLDRETAKIDALIAEQERLVALLDEKRQAVITQAVTKGLDPTVPMKDSGVEWLGHVPAHWTVTRIANVLREVIDAGSDELPILSVSIHSGVSDKELPEEELERKVSRSDDRSKYKAVQPNDLVYNMMRAWQGAFGTVRTAGMVSPAYVVARPIRTISTEFIELLLRTPAAVEQMRRFSRGVTDFRLRLYWDEFRNIRIALPPKREADDIVRQLSVLSDKTARVAAESERSTEVLRERRAALISAAVTGQIDVRGLVEAESA